jgi:hypothetical protein
MIEPVDVPIKTRNRPRCRGGRAMANLWRRVSPRESVVLLKTTGPERFSHSGFCLQLLGAEKRSGGAQRSAFNWPHGHHGEQPLLGLREHRCILVARRANECYLAGARLSSHLPGEPVKARMNPVHTLVATVRSLILILDTSIVFHAANLGR